MITEQKEQMAASVAITEEPLGSSKWTPRWIVNVGHNCHLGLTTDDRCFVVLYPKKDGSWCPGTHIPTEVAIIIGKMATIGINRYTLDCSFV